MSEKYVIQEYMDNYSVCRYRIDLTEHASVSFVFRDNAEQFLSYLNNTLSKESLEIQLKYMEGFVRHATEQAESNRKDVNHATQTRQHP